MHNSRHCKLSSSSILVSGTLSVSLEIKAVGIGSLLNAVLREVDFCVRGAPGSFQ